MFVKKLTLFLSNFVRILVVKKKGETDIVKTFNTLIYSILSLLQTESLKLATTIEITSASKMSAKGTFFSAG